MSNVNIIESDDKELSISYVKLDIQIKKLKKDQDKLKKELIERAEKGTDFKDFGITVYPISKPDIPKIIEKWEESGIEVPKKLIPEHEEIDMQKLESMIDWDDYSHLKIIKKSWGVRIKK